MSWSKSLVLAACASAAASAVAAEPLVYTIPPAVNLLRVQADGELRVSLVPPVGEPLDTFVQGINEFLVKPSGSATADTGLPDSFNGGTQEGIYISTYQTHLHFQDNPAMFYNIFGPLIPLLPVPVPIPLIGALAFIDIADLHVEMVTPLSSNLISIPDPNVYHWGGVAGLRISGSINLIVSIPGREPIAAGPVPFDQIVDPAALAGDFTGDAVSTRLVIGSEDAVITPDQIPPIAPIVIPLDPLLGSISVTMNRLRIAVRGNVTGVNNQYGLPQQTQPFPPGGGCGIGPELVAVMPLLGWLWRRKRGALAG